MLSLNVDPNVLLGFVLALVRATAWLVITPPFSSRAIPTMAKVGIGGGLAMAASTQHIGAVPVTTAGFVMALIYQAVTGLALGFIVLTLFSAVEAAGSVISLFGGLSVPPSLDPLSLNSAGPLGQLYELIAITLLFTMGGDLLLVKGFLMSFGANGWTLQTSGSLAYLLTHDLATLFSAGLLISAPLLVVLFLAQGVLGVLARISPQMNVMTLAFPFQIMLTIAIIVVGITILPQDLSQLIGRALSDGNLWLRAK